MEGRGEGGREWWGEVVSCGRVIDTWSRRRGWRGGEEGGEGGRRVRRTRKRRMERECHTE